MIEGLFLLQVLPCVWLGVVVMEGGGMSKSLFISFIRKCSTKGAKYTVPWMRGVEMCKMSGACEG
jgi:hypothetical protein